MKKITWFGSIGSGTAGVVLISALLLTQAGVSDQPHSILDKNTMTANQAATLFGPYADDHCPMLRSKVQKIEVKLCLNTEKQARYCNACVSRDCLPPDEYITARLTYEEQGYKVSDPVVDGPNECFTVEKTGELLKSEALAYLGSYASAACAGSASNVLEINLNKQPDNSFNHDCKVALVDTPDNIHALRVTAKDSPNRTVKYLGIITQE